MFSRSESLRLIVAHTKVFLFNCISSCEADMVLLCLFRATTQVSGGVGSRMCVYGVHVVPPFFPNEHSVRHTIKAWKQSLICALQHLKHAHHVVFEAQLVSPSFEWNRSFKELQQPRSRRTLGRPSFLIIENQHCFQSQQ